jgi:hypothetical protein
MLKCTSFGALLGFPSITCTESPAQQSLIRTCVNHWPKGIKRTEWQQLKSTTLTSPKPGLDQFEFPVKRDGTGNKPEVELTERPARFARIEMR